MRHLQALWKISLIMLAFLPGVLKAQESAITGTVTDEATGSGLPGVSILVKGTTVGTTTDLDGNYSLNVGQGSTLVFSYVGYITQEVGIASQTTLDIKLKEDITSLEEVVVIGYGQVKKKDATGSVVAIDEEDFNKGAVVSTQELITGRIAGVQITPESGEPGAASQIRIRGGSSLSASNDPLIVIDGVPISNKTISGLGNALSSLNPNDIETVTVLKDASATAIYGSRASNGVILVTTKSGSKGKEVNVNYNTKLSLGTPNERVDVLSADEFRAMIQERYADNQDALDLLGTANTDWQDEIFQNAFGQDHHLSVHGNVKEMPYRVSLGYTNHDGIIKTSNFERYSTSLGFNPEFLDGHLGVSVNFQGSIANSRFANKDAIGAALEYDPTQPVYSTDNTFGGYQTWVQDNGDPIKIATPNPVAKIEQRRDEAEVKRGIGNVALDYKFHFLPELSVKTNLGFDYSETDGSDFEPENVAWLYDPVNGGGKDKNYVQKKKNELLDVYLDYGKDFESLDSRVDAMAGYSWQHFWETIEENENNVAGTKPPIFKDDPQEYFLISFFGRLNYTFKDRYILTVSFRQDQSSRFSKDNRKGNFPAAAFAWKINEEPFMSNLTFLSELKFRAGYGVTGQQELFDDWYPYLPIYTYSRDDARYTIGNGLVTTLRPEGYDANIKWEETTTYNVGFDFGFMANRIYGSIEYYKRITEDLLNKIPVPAGSNLTNEIMTNVGDLENEGVEFSINGKAISRVDMYWDLGFNLSYNKNKITKLTATDDPTYQGVPVGDISGGVGNKIQIHSVDYPTYSFFVYEQVYDEDGKPVEGLYVDRNGDGQITSDDKYHYKKAAPDVFMGFSSNFVYKNWDFSFNGRINVGNYVYSNVDSHFGSYNNLYNSVGYLKNLGTSIYDTQFENPRLFSDHYIQNASFLRMDNISLGYTFKTPVRLVQSLRVYASVQNAFIITKYDGMTPEVKEGRDDNIYPHPRTYLFGLSVDF